MLIFSSTFRCSLPSENNEWEWWMGIVEV